MIKQIGITRKESVIVRGDWNTILDAKIDKAGGAIKKGYTINQQILAAIKFGISQNKVIWWLLNLASPRGPSIQRTIDVYVGGQILAKTRNSPNSPNIIARQKLLIYSTKTLEMKSLIIGLDLRDIWRLKNPTVKRFTFHQSQPLILGDKVSMLTHIYPHKPWREIEVTICKITRLTAHFMCGLMSDLLICTCL